MIAWAIVDFDLHVGLRISKLMLAEIIVHWNVYLDILVFTKEVLQIFSRILEMSMIICWSI